MGHLPRRFSGADRKTTYGKRVTLDHEDIEAIAEKVAELISPGTDGKLITVSQLSESRGLSQDWIYANAAQLGAIRLGDGPRARLRFSLAKADAYLATLQVVSPVEPKKKERKRRKKVANGSTPYGVPRLEVKG